MFNPLLSRETHADSNLFFKEILCFVFYVRCVHLLVNLSHRCVFVLCHDSCWDLPRRVCVSEREWKSVCGGEIDEWHLTLSELICPSLKVALRLYLTGSLSSFLLLTLLYTSLKQQKQKEPVRIVLGGRSACFVSQPGELCCKMNNRRVWHWWGVKGGHPLTAAFLLRPGVTGICTAASSAVACRSETSPQSSQWTS